MDITANSHATNFAILDPALPGDYQRWMTLWSTSPNREVYAHPNYVTLFSEGIGAARCACLAARQGTVIYPFVLRTVDIPNIAIDEPKLDITSPYGYGGWFAWNLTDRDNLQRQFHLSFDTWADAMGIVTEFVRFSLFESDLLLHPATPTARSTNVVRSLALNEEEIWQDYEAKVRKNVNKALRSNVRIDIDERGDTVEEFYRIYQATMLRRNAAVKYHHSPEFFQRFNELLRYNFAYFHATYEGQIVSSELVLVSANSVYSFLGGTEHTSFSVRPNDLLKHEITLWAKAKGKQHFVLGGGYQPNDGIFRYKKAFAPNGLVSFRTGERILKHREYHKLVEMRKQSVIADGKSWDPLPEYFPQYRAG